MSMCFAQMIITYAAKRLKCWAENTFRIILTFPPSVSMLIQTPAHQQITHDKP